MDQGEPREQNSNDVVSAIDLADLTAGTYRRGGEEFSRFTGFSDGVFGFAMTLLISTVAIPLVRSEDLGMALKDEIPDLLSFFVSFVVIGYFWMGHHRLFAALDSVSLRIMRLNLALMALIAFMPFPTALLGRYTENPISVIIFAVALSLAAVIQALMLRQARADGLLRVPMDDAAYRSVTTAALIPAVVFAVSAVTAIFAVDWAPMIWILIIPLEWLVGKRAPESARVFG